MTCICRLLYNWQINKPDNDCCLIEYNILLFKRRFDRVDKISDVKQCIVGIDVVYRTRGRRESVLLYKIARYSETENRQTYLYSIMCE